MFTDDTICAIATAIGEGGIGIIRISGSSSINIANTVFAAKSGRALKDLASYRAAYGHAVDPDSGEIIDEALALVMRAPHSYTREDVVEIHCHGGPTPLRQILRLVMNQGARLAEPGEFTQRAFLNGRLDLTQAEAVIDIIRAKTDASMRVAVSQLGGGLSEKVRAIRQEILKMIAHLEAAIDFPEEDIEEITVSEVAGHLRPLQLQLADIIQSACTGRILREGLKTVIIGKPNVGKSSLLNALLKEQRAIVTEIPGTTRDTIEEYVNIRGIPLNIVDTAGIRETDDIVEKLGVERTKAIIGSADLVLLLLDASQPISAEDRMVLNMLVDRSAIVLLNKSDLPVLLDRETLLALAPGKRLLDISVLLGTGLDKLEAEIEQLVYSGQTVGAARALITNARQLGLAEAAKRHLDDAVIAAQSLMPPDCVVIDLRGAWDKLGDIIGESVGDDIVNQIFSQFCIGK